MDSRMKEKKTYAPDNIERKWYQHWEKNNFFEPQGKGTPYCIMIPPPNVTGSLHMGHAFQQTLMDVLIRYHRMKGDNTLWQVGTDHAGIATQMVVERQLQKQGTHKTHLGREAFIKKIWEWKAQSGNTITQQLRRLGASVDWQRERFTLDTGLSQAVQKVFIDLYNEGLIYRGKRLVNWDPVLLTAVSDLEVDSEEEQGTLWYIRYPLVLVDETLQETSQERKNMTHITVATTRPETMLGDVAVAVNPLDERYGQLVGQYLILPLTDRKIPIIADKEIDPEFGTGAVKVTPAHDFTDYLIGKRHHLPEINILTLDAKLNENTPPQYQGLDRFEARKQILKDLKSIHCLEKEEPHLLRVPRGDRSNAVLEPMLTDQWFVSMEGLAKPALKVVEKGEVRFVPDNWKKTYFEWLNNIQDWCISRQLWWGHRIPAWYDENGKVYVGTSLEEIKKRENLSDELVLTQDEDVLDTWFSSALWPFSTLGWPEQTNEINTFYPTQVLITGFDIIFFWVARMVMFGLKFTGKIPFHEVYINGLILDQDGQKMSKTKGNVIDPIDLIDGIDLESLVQKRTAGLMQPQLAERIENDTRKQFPKGISAFGTDALRFTYCSLATQARYIRFDLPRIEGYRFFCNKLWNAARYVFMNTEEFTKDLQEIAQLNTHEVAFTLPCRYIVSCFQQLKRDIHHYLQTYRFDLASQVIYDFTWNEFCDWYLELSKPILNQPNDSLEKKCTRWTLITLLEELLRLMHPFMPYITEELWQECKSLLEKTGKKMGSTIMLEPYPEYDETKQDIEAIEEIAWIKEFITSIRNIRGENNISPGKTLPVLLYVSMEATVQESSNQSIKEVIEKRIHQNLHLLKTVAKLSSIEWILENENKPKAATKIMGALEILIPLEGLIDVKQEVERLDKLVEKLDKELEKIKNKLSVASFRENAPKMIVEQEEKRYEELLNEKNTLMQRKFDLIPSA